MVFGTGLVLELTLEEAGLEPQDSFPVILQSHGPALLCLKGPFAAEQLSGYNQTPESLTQRGFSQGEWEYQCTRRNHWETQKNNLLCAE